jgi:hypothetical protein
MERTAKGILQADCHAVKQQIQAPAPNYSSTATKSRGMGDVAKL